MPPFEGFCDPRFSILVLRTRVMLLGWLLLGLLVGCQEKETAVGFRNDGTLTFLTPEDAVLHTIEIEIADDPATRGVGLMNRTHMTLDQGMLFVYPEAASRRFWMKSTSLPLDIIFLDAERNIITIAKNRLPFSEEHVLSTRPTQYVVEVFGGFSDQFGITEDTRIRWQRNQQGE